MSSERIEHLLQVLDRYDGKYKRQEMEEAVALREEITPYLIRILEDLAADPMRFYEEGHEAHLYAAALLAHFEEPAAHVPIIKAFSIPSELVPGIWGDMDTESLPALLLQTCNASLSGIEQLILNRSVDEYVRGSASRALMLAVARGFAEREEVVSFLSGLFTGTEAEKGSGFWTSVACDILDLHPEGAVEVLKKAYADGRIDTTFLKVEDIEEESELDKVKVLESLQRKLERNVPTNIHDYLSWFNCYREDVPKGRIAGQSFLQLQKKKKSENRAKNKQAKKAKRKNRK